jgi:hypothetical protein
MVNATPVLSPVISDLTSVPGDFVGKGPSVSVGVTVQEPDELVIDVESVEEEELSDVSFLQALANGAIAARPKAANPFFKKCFLSIINYLGS